MNLKSYIRDVPDFPKPGILFRDITPLLKSAEAFVHTIDLLCLQANQLGAEVIVGIESRGFIFGCPLAYKLKLPFVPVRKPGKLPAEHMSIEYSLEYDSNQLDIHKDALRPGQRVIIIDDLLATGGTARACAKLVELSKAQVQAMLFVIELEGLSGREKLSEYKVSTLVTYP